MLQRLSWKCLPAWGGVGVFEPKVHRYICVSVCVSIPQKSCLSSQFNSGEGSSEIRYRLSCLGSGQVTSLLLWSHLALKRSGDSNNSRCGSLEEKHPSPSNEVTMPHKSQTNKVASVCMCNELDANTRALNIVTHFSSLLPLTASAYAGSLLWTSGRANPRQFKCCSISLTNHTYTWTSTNGNILPKSECACVMLLC